MKWGAFLPKEFVPSTQPYLDYCFLEPMPDPYYIDHYAKRPSSWGEVILDNGLIELGKSISIPQLLEYSKLVKADYVISPDRVGDWRFNQRHARELSRYFPKGRIIVVLGGRTPASFAMQSLWCRLAGFKYVSLPYRLNRNSVPLFDMKLHLLGMKSREDFSVYPSDTSIDTTDFINAAIFQCDYQKEGWSSFARHMRYFEWNFTSTTHQLILSNLAFMKERCK